MVVLEVAPCLRVSCLPAEATEAELVALLVVATEAELVTVPMAALLVVA
jgi:hypothetical protein